MFDVDSPDCLKSRGKFGYCVHANFYRRTALYYCPLQIRAMSECGQQYGSVHDGPHPKCAMIHHKMEECFKSAHMKEREQFRKNINRTIDHSVGSMCYEHMEKRELG